MMHSSNKELRPPFRKHLWLLLTSRTAIGVGLILLVGIAGLKPLDIEQALTGTEISQSPVHSAVVMEFSKNSVQAQSLAECLLETYQPDAVVASAAQSMKSSAQSAAESAKGAAHDVKSSAQNAAESAKEENKDKDIHISGSPEIEERVVINDKRMIKDEVK